MEFKDIVDLGMSGILLFLLSQVWGELKTTNARIFNYLEQARQDRQRMADAMHVSLQSDPHMKRPPLEPPH